MSSASYVWQTISIDKNLCKSRSNSKFRFGGILSNSQATDQYVQAAPPQPNSFPLNPANAPSKHCRSSLAKPVSLLGAGTTHPPTNSPSSKPSKLAVIKAWTNLVRMLNAKQKSLASLELAWSVLWEAGSHPTGPHGGRAFVQSGRCQQLY